MSGALASPDPLVVHRTAAQTPVMRRSWWVLVLTVFVAACGGGETPSASPAATEEPSAASEAPEPAGGGAYGNGGDAASEAAPGGGNAVSVSNFQFSPGDLTVTAGSTVEWTIADGNHTVTFEDDEETTSGNLGSGETYSRPFDEAGEYPYFCELHPDAMRATVTVE